MNQVIPISTSANQTFNIQVNVDAKVLTLQLAITFSEMAQYWLIAISDASGNLLLSSIPLLTGDCQAANILAQYAYLAIGSAYIINAGQAAIDYPDAVSLGTQFVLVWSDTAP